HVGLEHVVLQHVGAGELPVVRDVGPVVVAHDVALAGDARLGVFGLTLEAVHPAAVDVRHRVSEAMRAADVGGIGIVVGRHTPTALGIGHAHRRHSVSHRDAGRAREGPEVAVERAVLLHDHDYVLDGVDRDRATAGRTGTAPGRHNDEHPGGDRRGPTRHLGSI